LGNKQREEVGKLYSTNSFCARKIGGKLVVSNIAEILETHFFNRKGSEVDINLLTKFLTCKV
jgi:hypothetical protein